MSNCENGPSNKNCKYHGSSQLYKKDGNTPVIALLGQPNSGKSTIFNMTTGSHQHVGNWPGKTVDQKEGECKWNGKRLIIADLPGSYSLSAGSDEEVITWDYISAGNADLVVVMTDASQLKLSLYMLADFVGMKVPAILVLNMIDVAKGQGIVIDTAALSEKLGVPVVTMSTIRKKDYRVFYENIETALTEKPIIAGEPMTTAKEKMAYIDDLLNGVITAAALTPLSGILRSGMKAISVHPLLISLICDVLINVLYFALMMASFVLSITLGFNLMEETDYLARISFLFDNTMSKVGLQGKTIMPFFMGLGCTIADTTGTRVVDNCGQRVLAIAMSWAVSCTATLSVVPTITIALFGSTGGFLVMVSIFLFMFQMMWVVYKVFGNSLSPLAATSRETHSAKWTAKIGVFYTLAALLIACVIYHIGAVIF